MTPPPQIGDIIPKKSSFFYALPIVGRMASTGVSRGYSWNSAIN